MSDDEWADAFDRRIRAMMGGLFNTPIRITHRTVTYGPPVPLPSEPTALIPIATTPGEYVWGDMSTDEIVAEMTRAVAEIDSLSMRDRVRERLFGAPFVRHTLPTFRWEPQVPIRVEPDPFRIALHARIGGVGMGRRFGKTAALESWLRTRAATEHLHARLRTIANPGGALLLEHLNGPAIARARLSS